MNIHNLATLASQLDEHIPELECHQLGHEEFVTQRVEDENDFGYICRYHEQYIDEQPDIHSMAEELTDKIVDKLWEVYYWDRAAPLYILGGKSGNAIYEDACGYADRRTNELEIH